MDKYVIFDIDGTLNQTALYAIEAYQKALKKRNIKITDEEIISCIGLSPKAIIKKLFGSLTEDEYINWRNDIKHYEFEIMKTQACAFEGMTETLNVLKDRGYKLGICSNAYREHIDSVLSAIQLEGYFDVIGSLELGSTKAEVLTILLKELKYNKACMVGDRKFDIEAARINHIPIIGCQYGYAPHEIQAADKVISKPIEILDIIDSLI